MNERLSQCIPLVSLWAAVWVLSLWSPASANAWEQLTSGTSSKQARQQAIQAVPFEQLNQGTGVKLKEVLEKPSIYRRLPITQIDIDPDYFVFLVRHPEVIVNIWQIMGITKMETERIGPYELNSSDGEGTTSQVELVYGNNNIHVYFATGSYQGPILRKKLHGRCVMILRSEYERGSNGALKAKCSLDVFLKVENATASLIARTLNPIVGSTADHNFVESLNFLQRLNETTEKNGAGVQRMAGRLQNITPQVRNDFVGIAGLVYQRNLTQAKPVGSSAIPPSSQGQVQGDRDLQRSGYPVRPSGFRSTPQPGVQTIPSTQPATLNPDTASYPETTQLGYPHGPDYGASRVHHPYYQLPYDRGVQPAGYYSAPGGVLYPGQRLRR